MMYEIWNTNTANLVAFYKQRDEALALVLSMAAEHGDESIRDWTLLRVDEAGNDDTVATGTDLLAQAKGRRALSGVNP